MKFQIRLLKNNFHDQKAGKKLYIRHYNDYLGFSNSCGVISV